MITNALIAICVHVFGSFLNSVLPHLSITGTINTVTSWAEALGAVIHIAGFAVPLTVLVVWVLVVSSVMVCLGLLAIFDFIWSHIPMIAGFGT